MSKTSQLEAKVNRFRHDIIKEELIDIATEAGIEIDNGDKTESVYQENLNKIVLPGGIDKIQAAGTLLKQYREEETSRVYNRNYPHIFLNDFLLVMYKVIISQFGMLHVSSTDTAGDKASNDYIQLPVGFNADGTKKTEQGYYGSITAPSWEDAIIDISPNGQIAVLAKLKFASKVDNFLSQIDRELASFSVVRGTSVKVLAVAGGILAEPIEAKINTSIVLSEDNERIIGNLIIPSLKDKSKTSMLFTGDFGTGKTETALRVGIEAQKRFNRTFFYLHNADMFSAIIPYLKNYQGALVFVEDVDQISDGDRDTKMNNLLNQLDGNELKGVDVTFIFTTNNHDKIHNAMRRPGRIDQIVHFDYCDITMISKIFELYAAGYEGAEEVDFDEAAKYCPEKLQGAVVAEIARRTLKYTDNLYNGVISTDRFKDAIASMRDHIEFMRKDQKKDNSVETLLAMVETAIQRKAFPDNFIDPEAAKANGPFVGVV